MSGKLKALKKELYTREAFVATADSMSYFAPTEALMCLHRCERDNLKAKIRRIEYLVKVVTTAKYKLLMETNVVNMDPGLINDIDVVLDKL